MSATALTPSRTDSAADKLRQEILIGGAAPGDLSAESAVAQRLGVSRVPVREALFALEREGLVEFSGTDRAYVKAVTPKDFEELYTLRITLEPLATRPATSKLRLDAGSLEKNIAATQRAKSVKAVARLDIEFHVIMRDAPGNARLLKLWQSMRGELELWLARLHLSHQPQTSETQRETVAAHTGIMQGLRMQASAASCKAGVPRSTNRTCSALLTVARKTSPST